MIDDCVRRQDVIQAIYNNEDRLDICAAVRRLEPAYPASYDCISRQSVLEIIHLFFTEEVYKIPTEKTEDGDVLTMGKLNPFLRMNKTLSRRIKELPSVTAEQTHEEWCTDCKEYDQEQHCCHRYCKIIRQTVDEIKQAERTGHCKDCKYFEYDSVAKVDGIPLIVAHEICSKWGDGCKTKEDGYCFLFEPKESEE